MRAKEKGYVLFQEFIPNSIFDIRVIVINNKAFAIKRMVRNGDFRASGSGNISFNVAEIPLSTIKIAFEITNKIQAQCIAYDFIVNNKEEPLLLEVSFAFAMRSYDKCPGYWDTNLQLHLGEINPQAWIIDLLK